MSQRSLGLRVCAMPGAIQWWLAQSAHAGDALPRMGRGESRAIMIGTAAMAVIWLIARRRIRASRSSGGEFGKQGRRRDSEDDFDWLTGPDHK